jgi:hypothetical protein
MERQVPCSPSPLCHLPVPSYSGMVPICTMPVLALCAAFLVYLPAAEPSVYSVVYYSASFSIAYTLACMFVLFPAM